VFYLAEDDDVNGCRDEDRLDALLKETRLLGYMDGVEAGMSLKEGANLHEVRARAWKGNMWNQAKDEYPQLRTEIWGMRWNR
jgi:hypothetical protein